MKNLTALRNQRPDKLCFIRSTGKRNRIEPNQKRSNQNRSRPMMREFLTLER